MVDAYRARIRELNISHETVDHISGLPNGYTSKLMAPKPMKGLGEKAIEGLNGALGIAFTVAIDMEAAEKVRARWVKRKRGVDKKKQAIMTEASTTLEIQITPELSAQIGSPEWRKMRSKHGGKRRAKIMGKRARQRIATHAARMRWSKEKRT